MNALLSIGSALLLCFVSQSRAAGGLCNLFGCGGGNQAQGYVSLNELLTAKLARSDQLAEAGQFARHFCQSSDYASQMKALTGGRDNEELNRLLETLARIDREQFGLCDSENLNALRTLTEARQEARKANNKAASQATKLNTLLDNYVREAATHCYQEITSKWAPSDEVFDELFGWNLKPLDRILETNRKLHVKGTKYAEARELDVGVWLSRSEKLHESRLFTADDFDEIVSAIYKHENGDEALHFEAPEDTLTRFIHKNLIQACAKYIERPESVRVLRPLVDLTAASCTTNGLSDVSLDGWFQDGRDGDHSFEWAARYALCTRISEMDARKLAKSIR